VQAVWSSGPDLWLAGTVTNTTTHYFGRWVDGRWLSYAVPPGSLPSDSIVEMWSGRPGQLWLKLQDRTLLRFDGSRWFSGGSISQAFETLSRSANDQFWALVSLSISRQQTFFNYHIAHLDNPHPPVTGGACPAQQELFCRESGHGVNEGPRTIATIVGGRFGAAHYVLNSTLSGRIRFEAQLPAEVEAIWVVADSSGTCPPGTPLVFSPNGMSRRAEQTIGPLRYYLTLRSRNFADPLDKTEYPVALDFSCNRID
jgi:hypothetical protein